MALHRTPNSTHPEKNRFEQQFPPFDRSLLTQHNSGTNGMILPMDIPALVLIWATQTLSPTIFEFRTWPKVQTGPYGCCLACRSGVLDDSDIWGQLGSILVLFGPDPLSVNLGRLEFLRRTVPGTPVETKNKIKINIHST